MAKIITKKAGQAGFDEEVVAGINYLHGMETSGFNWIGFFTPTIGTEYPTPIGTNGTFTLEIDYDFTTGDLATIGIIPKGTTIAYDGTKWGVIKLTQTQAEIADLGMVTTDTTQDITASKTHKANLFMDGYTGGYGLFFRPELGTDTAQPSIVAWDNSGDLNKDGLRLNGFDGISFFINDLEKLRASAGGRLLVNKTTDDGVNALQVNGAISTGGVGFRVIELTGTTGATEGSTVSVVSGIDNTKIIGFDCIVRYGGLGTGVHQHDNEPTYNFSCSYDSTSGFNLTLKAGDSSSILEKPFTIIVFYKI